VFERFTERARQVVVLAQDEARLLKHDHIGEEHLLLGLLREEDGVAARVLRESGVELEDTRRHVRAVVGEGEGPTAGQIPFTPRAKAALERALRESLSLGSSYIGTEHVLLGLLREPGDVLGKVLENAGSDTGAIVSRAVHRPGRPAAVPLEFPKGSESERFTERARRAVALAQDEARTLTHNYVGTEHILLGLLREEEGLAARVLDALHITIDDVRAQVARVVGVGDEVMTGEIPFTPRAKKVLELALREALSLGHNYIGTEHILLGVARATEGVGARILLDFDADAERIHMEVVRTLSGPGGGTRPRVEPPVVVIPCPSCGTKLSYLEVAVGQSGSFKAERRGTTTCSGCGARYDLRYRIEWRPAG
jgi:ATP-dependent Clp protease ATP-binding subunit ClpA